MGVEDQLIGFLAVVGILVAFRRLTRRPKPPRRTRSIADEAHAWLEAQP
jgi:hypothetical protein